MGWGPDRTDQTRNHEGRHWPGLHLAHLPCLVTLPSRPATIDRKDAAAFHQTPLPHFFHLPPVLIANEQESRLGPALPRTYSLCFLATSPLPTPRPASLFLSHTVSQSSLAGDVFVACSLAGWGRGQSGVGWVHGARLSAAMWCAVVHLRMLV